MRAGVAAAGTLKRVQRSGIEQLPQLRDASEEASSVQSRLAASESVERSSTQDSEALVARVRRKDASRQSGFAARSGTGERALASELAGEPRPCMMLCSSRVARRPSKLAAVSDEPCLQTDRRSEARDGVCRCASPLRQAARGCAYSQRGTRRNWSFKIRLALPRRSGHPAQNPCAGVNTAKGAGLSRR